MRSNMIEVIINTI